MTSLERIDYAINRLKTVGWCQGWSRLDQRAAGPACLFGSLMTDQEYEAGAHARSREVVVLALRPITRAPSLISWNDKPGRTKEDVITALEQVRPQFLAKEESVE